MVYQLYKICKIELHKLNKRLKGIFKDNQGQVFSIDALFAIIIITIIIGMSANAVDIVGFKISDYRAGKSLDRIATDAAEILVNTPGSPDWEKSNSTMLVTPGLAQDNNGSKNTTKVLSFAKIAQLKNRYPELMGNVLPRGGSSSLTIYPMNSTLKPLELSNKTPSADVTEVAVVNRTVLVNFRDFRILTCIGNYLSKSSHSELCPHYNYKGVTVHGKPNYNNITSGWNCGYFKITQKDLNTTDFYILTDPSILNDNMARWMMDGPDKISEEQEIFQPQPILVNDKICRIIDDDEEGTLWIHVLNSGDASETFNTYLIGVPKGTSSEEVRIEYLNPYPCFFILKIWME